MAASDRQSSGKGGERVSTFDRVALLLVIIGALNWLLVGLFSYDLVAGIFGGMTSIVSRIIYVIVGLAGLWMIPKLFASPGR